MPRLAADERQYRDLFQKAVRNYFTYTLDQHRWTVASKQLRWQHRPGDPGAKLLPVMQTDTVLHDRLTGRRIVIETKFADALIDRFGNVTIKSDYLYQLYAYLMSQSNIGQEVGDRTEGVLLFVKVNGREPIDTVVNIQGHRIRFLSVDLTGEPKQIRQCWQRCLDSDNP